MPRQRLFQMVLFAYPREFRYEYGKEMEQFFRDCYRAEKKTRGRLGVGGLWFRTILDLARAAPREHFKDAGGRVTEIVLRINGREFHAKKIR